MQIASQECCLQKIHSFVNIYHPLAQFREYIFSNYLLLSRDNSFEERDKNIKSSYEKKVWNSPELIMK